MQNTEALQEIIREIITRDPYIAGHLLSIKLLGIEDATLGRTVILFYASPKKDIYLILDPWTEQLTIRDETKGTAHQFHIKKVLKAMVDLYGIPETEAIQKFGTNITV
jgi:hypothetical protein